MPNAEPLKKMPPNLTAGTLSTLARWLIWLYQAAMSPFLGPCCRFAPTCSAYADEALHRHGTLRGSWMALRRVLRCHPFHPGGWDPVA